MEKVRKFGIERSYTGYILCQVHLLSTACYILFPGENCSRVSRINHTMRQSQQELNQAQCCTRGAKGILRILPNKYVLALGLITTAPYGGKSGGFGI